MNTNTQVHPGDRATATQSKNPIYTLYSLTLLERLSPDMARCVRKAAILANGLQSVLYEESEPPAESTIPQAVLPWPIRATVRRAS